MPILRCSRRVRSRQLKQIRRSANYAAIAASVAAIAATPGAIAQPCVPAWDNGFDLVISPPPVGNPGLNGEVLATALFDDGTGPALYVGGFFTTAGGVPANNIAKWDGSTWSPLGSGTGTVFALVVFDVGTGPALYVGGKFTTAGGMTVNSIAKWDGQSWNPLGSGVSAFGFTPSVLALTVFDDGTGPALYAGGDFRKAGGVSANSIARWNGSTWSPLGSGMNSTVIALTVFDDGSGPALYAGGNFTTAGGVTANNIAKWNSSFWSALGSGVGNTVNALAVFDDGTGPALYAGGGFTTAGGVTASNIAKWDGTAWSVLGSGVGGGSFPRVRALAVFDNGTGPALYAGGGFTTAGGVTASRIARWNGSSWSPLGSGVTTNTNSGQVSALTVFDDGTGSALYAGGIFTSAGGSTASFIGKWNGAAWFNVLGVGADNVINKLTTVTTPTGTELFATGAFVRVGGVETSRGVGRFDGQQWQTLGGGVSGGLVNGPGCLRRRRGASALRRRLLH